MVALPRTFIWPDITSRFGAKRYAWHVETQGNQMRIPAVLRDSVVFQYRTRDEAERHVRIGGTSFLVGHQILNPDGSSTSYCVPYLVTNKHVAGLCPVVRVNRRDGGKPDVFELEERDWTMHPDGDDVAITPVLGKIKPDEHKISFGYTDWILTEKMMSKIALGVGEEVFMVGRFINHQGAEENIAAVRFGSISVMPEPIYNKAILKNQLSFAVEMRSRTGFSGGMVVAYRTPATILDDVPIDHFHVILGVNWGYVLDENGENTWLNGVVPGWKIMDLFDVPRVKAFQAEATAALFDGLRNEEDAAMPGLAISEAEMRKSDNIKDSRPTPPKGKASTVSESGNPAHKEDFTSLLTEAARMPPQDD